MKPKPLPANCPIHIRRTSSTYFRDFSKPNTFIKAENIDQYLAEVRKPRLTHEQIIARRYDLQ